MSNPAVATDPIMIEASRWLMRRRAGLEASEAREFDAWIDSAPAHKLAFETVGRAWRLMGQVEDDDALLDVCDHDEGIIEDRRRRITAIAAAAAFVVLGGGGWVATKVGPKIEEWLGAPAQDFQTSVGQRATTTLIDGSVVTLDTDSAIRVRVTGQKRFVELQRGRAFFKIAKDRHRPFVVAASGRTVRAVGTAFDVRVEPGRFEVTLLEGRVQVREARPQQEGMPVADLRQGWRLAVGADERWRMEPVDLIQAAAWHEGMLVFRDEPLVQAVAEMNRYSRRKITFRGEPPKGSVLGRFPAGDVDAFARGLELNKIARIVAQTDEEIEIAGR